MLVAECDCGGEVLFMPTEGAKAPLERDCRECEATYKLSIKRVYTAQVTGRDDG